MIGIRAIRGGLDEVRVDPEFEVLHYDIPHRCVVAGPVGCDAASGTAAGGRLRGPRLCSAAEYRSQLFHLRQVLWPK